MCLSFQTVFTKEMERELVQYILVMEEIMFGIGTAEVRSLVYQLAGTNKL